MISTTMTRLSSWLGRQAPERTVDPKCPDSRPISRAWFCGRIDPARSAPFSVPPRCWEAVAPSGRDSAAYRCEQIPPAKNCLRWSLELQADTWRWPVTCAPAPQRGNRAGSQSRFPSPGATDIIVAGRGRSIEAQRLVRPDQGTTGRSGAGVWHHPPVHGDQGRPGDGVGRFGARFAQRSWAAAPR